MEPSENATDWLVGALREAAGDNLISLTLTPSYRGQPQDGAQRLSTLTIVLTSTDADALAKLREPLREGQRRIRISPFILKASELPNMLDCLPLKALMTRLQGNVLHGDNPFAGLPIDAEHVRLRLEQEIRNLVVRLRHDLVLAPEKSHQLTQGMWRTVRGVERILEGLAILEHGEEALPDDLWAAGAADWDLPRDRLQALAGFGKGEPPSDLRSLASDALPLLEAMVRCVDAAGSAE